MKRKNSLPELLAPAGSPDALRAAVSAGADAVYIGGKQFGARAFSRNFSEEEIEWAVLYCHQRGVKLYVTVNTLIYDKELPSAIEFCEKLYNMGVDAVIICDIGLVSELRRRLPRLELHASTQMGIHNTEGANLAFSLGMKRVVLARECSYENIRSVVEKSSAECEIFIHGALCVCHSGQCLFSSLVGGRSGNRGECAQPCRLKYNGKYPLSLKDLSLAKHAPQLISLGVASLKIEGRMKSPEYVYTVVSIYRRLLDENRAATPREISTLESIFSREGFTDGYFTGKKHERMTGIRSDGDKQQTKEVSVEIKERFPEEISCYGEFKIGAPSRLTLTLPVYSAEIGRCAYISASFSGGTPAAAISAPLTKEGVFARLSKLGGTGYTLSRDRSELTVDDGINMPPSQINELRRGAIEEINKQLKLPLRYIFGEADNEQSEANTAAVYPIKSKGKLKTAVFYNSKLLAAVVKSEPGLLDLFDVVFSDIEAELPPKIGKTDIGIIMPPVIMDDECEKADELAKSAAARGVKYALVTNIGNIALAKKHGFDIIGDFRLNISNRSASSAYFDMGITDAVLSPELTLPQARDIGGGVVVMGRIPLMLTERCFIKENFGCEGCGKAALTDRMKKEFPMLREFGHRNIIFNSTPTYMGDEKSTLAEYKIYHEHFIFSTEDFKEFKNMRRLYALSEKPEFTVRRIGRR